MEVILGAIIAILITITVESLRRPSLRLIIEQPPCDMDYRGGPPRPAQQVRYLRLRLFNKPLPWWARWMQRSPALQCRGAITFHHHDDGQNVFGRAMTVRWSGSPQPIPLEGVTPQGERFQILDPMRLTTDSRIDVYPGETELLDVAVRLDEDEQCYGWNNEAYFSSGALPAGC